MLKVFLFLIIVPVLFLTWNYWRFTAAIRGDIAQLETAALTPANAPIIQGRLTTLPEPAQRYFHRSGVLGTKIPTIIRLTQKGRIRAGADQNWLQLEAEEIYSTNPPAFVWRAWFPRKSIPIAVGRDKYSNGKGSILIKMLATFNLASDTSPELGRAGLMRYLNEMLWFPAAYLADNISISAVDSTSFRVTITDNDLEATAVIVVSQDGDVVNFIAERFYTTTKSIETWQTPITASKTFQNLSLPSTGYALWKLQDGDFTYIELDITAVEYQF